MSSARFDPATTGPHGLAISNLAVRLLSEILDAWFAAHPSDADDDRANVAHLAEIEAGL